MRKETKTKAPDEELEISVVVPVFNEQENIEPLYQRLTAVMEDLGESYEIIFADDGSRDRSFEILEKLHWLDNRVSVVKLARNFGQHPAVTAGFQQAIGRVIVTLDGDLQNPPEEIPKLLAKLAEGYDVVSGWREHRKDSFLRRFPSILVNWLIGKLTGVKLKDYGCMLRAYRREVIELLGECKESGRFITALTSWLGVSIAEVKVEHHPRAEGKSKYSWLKLLTMNFDLVTGFSIFPLQVISFIGMLMSGLGFLSGLFLLGWRFIYGAGPAGLLSFVALLLFLFGLQLFAIGMIGEYIGRIYVQSLGRPYFIVYKLLENRSRPHRRLSRQPKLDGRGSMGCEGGGIKATTGD